MMQIRYLAVLTLALFSSGVSFAQIAFIQNSASFPGGIPDPEFLQRISYFASPGPGQLAPRMLAVLADPTLVSRGTSSGAKIIALVPDRATLSIRPINSDVAIPVTNVTPFPGGVRFIVPAGVPTGDAELIYSLGSGPTQWTHVTVLRSSFAFFSDSFSNRPNIEIPGTTGPNRRAGLASPVVPGQIIRLTGSGLGYGASVSATIGGVAAPLIYAGPGTGLGGVDDILLQVPQLDAGSLGCYVPLAIRVNNFSGTTPLSVTQDGAPCRHPLGFSVADLGKLDTRRSVPFIRIGIWTMVQAQVAGPAYLGQLVSSTLGELAVENLAALFTTTPPGDAVTCSSDYSGAWFAADIAPGSVLQSRTLATGGGLDIGEVSLTQPGRPAVMLRRIGDFDFQLKDERSFTLAKDGGTANLPTLLLQPGGVVWQNSGGKDLSAGQIRLEIPSPLLLKGGTPLFTATGGGLKVDWDGSAFDARTRVSLQFREIPTYCRGQARAGSISMPAGFLTEIPKGLIGVVSASASAYRPITVLRLANGDPLVVLFDWFSTDDRTVDFR